MAVKLSRLVGSGRIVEEDGRPTLTFARYWQGFAEQIERAINAIAEILGITDELDKALAEVRTQAQNAKDAAEAANQAAADASAANAAQQREVSIQTSYIEPASVLTATPTSITVLNHTRYYPQASGEPVAVSVTGGTIGSTAPGTVAYVSYVDPERDGGSVTYAVQTSPPTQTGDTHVVGAVEIPDTGEVDGGDGPTRPGYVRPREKQLAVE